MKCQNCDAPVLASDERCERCGAKLLHRTVFFGVPKPEEFTLTAEEPVSDQAEAVSEVFPPRAEVWRAAQPVVMESALRYGGFWRRLGAFVIDFLMICILCVLMGFMGYIGYKVGLAGHGRRVTFSNASPLVALLTFSVVFLASAYFVVFHGMDGQTIGKSVLHLRVVGAEQQRITYRRALLRWIGMVGLGVGSLGLGILWIAWSREKRAWHDYLARTWVIYSG